MSVRNNLLKEKKIYTTLRTKIVYQASKCNASAQITWNQCNFLTHASAVCISFTVRYHKKRKSWVNEHLSWGIGWFISSIFIRPLPSSWIVKNFPFRSFHFDTSVKLSIQHLIRTPFFYYFLYALFLTCNPSYIKRSCKRRKLLVKNN